MKTNRSTFVDRVEELFFAVLLLGAGPVGAFVVATLLEPHAPTFVRIPVGLITGVLIMFVVFACGIAFDSPFDHLRRWMSRNLPPPDAAQACEGCSCRQDALGFPASPEKLEELRAVCPAVRVFVPDARWNEFRQWHRLPSDSGHQSVVLLALERGCLHRLCTPVRRWLLGEEPGVTNMSAQYRVDLQETWMFDDDAVRRHRGSKRFRSRLGELLFAEWLRGQGYCISSLEAADGGPDVVAAAASGPSQAFEVKWIGATDDDFAQFVLSIDGCPSGGAFSPASATNYLLLRVAEAAQQLRTAESGKVAVIIVDDFSWWRFSLGLDSGWIDWRQPSFRSADQEWSKFLEIQMEKKAQTVADLVPLVASLDEVWVFRQTFDFKFVLAHRFGTA